MPFTSPGTGIMPGVGGGGFMSGLSRLFQNKLFLQYLAAEGQDLLQNTPGKNLNAVTQQSIASEAYAKMLSEILGGGKVPEGITHTRKRGLDTDQTSLSIDHSLFKMPDLKTGTNAPLTTPGIITPSSAGTMTSGGQFAMGSVTPDITRFLSPFLTSQQVPSAPSPAGSPSEGVTTAAPVAQAQTPAIQDPVMQMLTQLLGGGSQSNLGATFGNMSKSDLAGLTPEMMSSALQFKMQQEQLGKKNIMDVMDLMMRGKELGIRAPYMKALTDEAIDRVAANQPVIQIGGIPYNTAEYLKWQQVQKENLSTNQRDYSTYAAQETAAGRQPKSFEEFLNNNFTNDIKNYRLYSDQETKAGRTPKDFDPWLTEHERSRTITTPEMAGEKAAAIKRATGAEEAWAQLHNPTQLNALVKKAVDDPVTANAIFAARDNPAEMTRIKGRTVAGVIDNMVRAGGGRFVKDTVLSKDGKTLTYTIKWPNHPEPEVFTYAIE